MMIIMRKSQANVRSAAKQASHERIVKVAARAIRRTGYDGTGVAELMKQAGLTHGAFYAHFASRDAMLAEAADRAGAEANVAASRVVASAPPERSLEALLVAYLSNEHRDNIETGCPVAALGSEMPRQSPMVRRAATARIKEMVELIAKQLPERGQIDVPDGANAPDRALVTAATLVGTLLLARAVDDPGLSDRFCRAALNSLA